MAKRIVDDSSLIKVADAIRNKCSTSDKLVFPDGFESAIASIDTVGDGITPTGTIYITENNRTFDVTTYASAEVNIPAEESEEVKLQTKSVTPRAEGWELTPSNGYTGFSKVTISGDADLVAANIKKNVNIFGVTGTYEATATSGENVVLQSITVTPTAAGFTKAPETGVSGFSEVVVKGDQYLVPGNVKKGVKIFDVTGSYEGSGDTGSSSSGSTLVTKNGTTTTATFDTGLSEIVAVFMKISETLQEKGLEHMTAIVPLNIYTYSACSSYNTQYGIKYYSAGTGNIGDTLNYCVLNGGEVTWNTTSSVTPAFIEGKTYSWSAVGYE